MKKKKKALGWWQKLNAGDPEKNIEIFNHIMTDHPNAEQNSSAGDTAMGEAIESMRENPETNLEAMKALNMIDEEFITPEQRRTEYEKHVLGKKGKEFAYFKNRGWSEEDYEKVADKFQNTPVDRVVKDAKVVGFVNQDGSRAKYFPKDKDQSYVFYRQFPDGSKKTISYYSMRGMGEDEYKLRKLYNSMDKKVNPGGRDKQRDLKVGENYDKRTKHR